MLAVISPAKKLNYTPVTNAVPSSTPEFQADAVRLAKTAKQLTLTGLRELMNISNDLARLNKERFQAFAAEPDRQATKQAALAFDGDTYQGLQANSFNAEELEFAQDHLRILSGLYGVLRPLDLMQPYRLEMGSRLKTRRGATLYAYWGEELAQNLNTASQGAPIVNLASTEYFKAVKSKALISPVITCDFKEEKDGALKTIGFFAKNARGAMARYMIQNRTMDVEGLKAFDLNGYKYQPSLSDETKLTFSRPSTT